MDRVNVSLAELWDHIDQEGLARIDPASTFSALDILVRDNPDNTLTLFHPTYTILLRAWACSSNPTKLSIPALNT